MLSPIAIAVTKLGLLILYVVVFFEVMKFIQKENAILDTDCNAM